MDKKQLQDIFSKPYSIELWQKVLVDIFDVKFLHQNPLSILLPTNDKASEAFELGNFNTKDDRIIGIYQVNIKPGVWLERNKVGLRELLRQVYKYDVDGALIVFVQDNKWRLSFVSEIRTLDEDGTIGVKKTEPKRYTYLLGRGEKIRTPVLRIISLSGKPIGLEDLRSAFSVEALNKEFYEIIADKFSNLIGGKRIRNGKTINYERSLILPSIGDGPGSHEIYQEFAVRLIGRTVFCWFLKVKKSRLDISLLPEHLLSSEAVKENPGYYHFILEKLFFQTLNTPMDFRNEDLPLGCEQVPFLNGGLFEQQDEDYYSLNKTTGLSQNINTLVIPDEWFFDFFIELEKYNFTIDENSVVDIEVSVDPEMLGRIFENLLAEIDPDSGDTARKSTGSFYTPREIVDYMTSQSLVYYIHAQTDISNERLEPLFKLDNGENIQFESNEKQEILKALDRIKILDPACGSGAFPIGMLQKIVMALQKLDSNAVWWKEKQVSRIDNPVLRKVVKDKLEKGSPEYARKLGIIQNSLYGVDIQPIAAEISKLRCFLTLVVDENIDETKPNRGIEPLPNLEFKFVTANSLFMLPDEEYYGGLFNANEDLDSLQQFRLDYLQSYGVEKQKIKENFLHLQTSIFKQQLSFGAKETSRAFKISTWNPFNHEKVDWFDPLWMYGVNTFDIVIGNPPYVNVEKIDTETKKYLFLKYKTCKGRTDLYIAFIERALKLFAKNTGLLTFIIPYPYTNQKYGTDSRKLLIDSYSILEILDTSEYRVFDAAVVKNITLFVGSEVSDTLTKIKKVNSQKNFLENKITESSINQSVFLTLKDYRLETKDVSTVSLLKSVIWNKSISLDNICLISYGARINHKTNGDKKEHYIFKDFKPGLKPFTEGKNIERFSFSQYGWLDYKPNEHYNSMFKELFENEKIMFINIVKDRLRFALDTKHFYNSHTVINCVKWDLLAQANHTTVKRNITPKKIQFGKEFSYKYLIAILNSTLINWYFLNFLSESLHFYPEDAKGLPIHLASAQRQQPFNNLVSYIIFLKALSVPNHVNEYVDNHHLVTMFEEIVDALVYELYFEDEFKNAGVEFFKYAERDFSIIDGLEDDNKMQVIHESYQKLRQKENEIRNNLKLMDTRLNQLIMPIKAAK